MTRDTKVGFPPSDTELEDSRTDAEIMAEIDHASFNHNDPDKASEFGLQMFELLRNGNEPMEEVVPKASRRSNAYAAKAARVKRLAELMIGLSPQQERFVHIYVAKDWDTLAEVAMRAGSTAKNSFHLRNIASQYLKNPKIKEAIGLLTISKLEAEGVDRYEVIAMLRDNHAMAVASGKLREANDAAEKLGIAIGMFSPKGAKGVTDLTKVEYNQLKELNQASSQTKQAQSIRDAQASALPSDELALELKSQLNIAQSGTIKH